LPPAPDDTPDPASSAADRTTLAAASLDARPIHLTDESGLSALLERLGPAAAAQAEVHRFTGKSGQLLVLAGPDGRTSAVVAGGAPRDTGLFRSLAARLPSGDYHLVGGEPDEPAAVAWALGGYAFDRYRGNEGSRPRLVVGEPALARALRIARACTLARDLVNAPANDLGPAELEAAAFGVALAHGASAETISGEALIAAGYPAIHAVGRAAAPHRAPRIVEIGWRAPDAGADALHLVLIGKGVVFDTGGLDLKPSAGMRLMKKDMGGAAHALALADMIMGEGLPVRLTVLLPIVENAVGGDAMRPGDVLATRAGLSVEVGNTDAEGRLILADALARAGELAPDLTIDLATLTGAARVALGPEVVPFYTDDDRLAGELEVAARTVGDPVWRMPLWGGYADALDSDVAHLKNDPDAWAQAGSVTAALFLQRFAPREGAWMHLDIYAWNPRKRPGWPAGGEAQAVRALFQLLRTRYET
jgi:leucyl aminopeptidase